MMMNPRQNNMGEIIRRRFRESELSIKRLSELADVPYASVHGLIQSERDIALSTASKLCAVLGLELQHVGKRKQR